MPAFDGGKTHKAEVLWHYAHAWLLVVMAELGAACGVDSWVLRDLPMLDAGADDGEATNKPDDATVAAEPMVLETGPLDRDPGPMDEGSLVASQDHTCVLRTGVAYCWGGNGAGQLGVGDRTDRSVPTRVVGSDVYVRIVAGETHTCGLANDGSVACWGGNEHGQLGLGTVEPSLVPQRVALPRQAREITAGYQHTCAVLNDNRLFCWGFNDEGQLGQGDLPPGTNQPMPIQVGTDWLSVTGGQGHTCAIKTDRTLYCWGRNTGGQLGQGPNAPIQIRYPVQVGSASDWIRLDAGQSEACGVHRTGRLECWGENANNHLGWDGTPVMDLPRAIDAETTWTRVSVDVFAMCGVRESAEVFCCGRNIEGQLGTGAFTDPLPLLRVDIDQPVMAVSVGRFHTCLLTTTGRVYCSGDNRASQLGVGDTERRFRFTLVSPY